ncbi:hypothetical protein [Pararhizobium mangrovi]|nr:hypothetical protein [Pararhizobium mangrovi]
MVVDIANERTRMIANALDRLSTAFLTVGVLAPAASEIYGNVRVAESLGVWTPFIVVAWFLSAIALHLTAHLVLGDLK